MQENKPKKSEKMSNQERFEDWMKNTIQHKDRANFEKMEKAMMRIIN